MSGLTLSGASAVSHDLYASVFRHRRFAEGAEIRVWQIATIVLGIVAIALGILFQKVNVAFMSGSLSPSPPARTSRLLLPMLWRGLTNWGAFVGLIGAVLSRGIWEAVLGHPKGSAWFPYGTRSSSPVMGSIERRAGSSPLNSGYSVCPDALGGRVYSHYIDESSMFNPMCAELTLC